MYDFALSLGAFLLVALGLGMAFSRALAGPPPPVSTGVSARSSLGVSLAVDFGALALMMVLAALLRGQQPDFWFVVAAILFLLAALLWSWITRPRRNPSGDVALSAQGRGSIWVGFGARLVAFAALAVFALLTRPPCPPCSGA